VDAAVTTPGDGTGRVRFATLRGLVLACHPLPTLAVTTFATVLAAAFGGRGGVLVAIAAATLSGQLCVGWSNDGIDAGRDRAAHRTDKPVGVGWVGRDTVLAAAAAAGVACIPLSLSLGLRPGILHLVAVLSALLYNAGLKSTPVSPLPYVLSFALLPVVTSLAVGSGWPPPGYPVAAGLLGAAAHAANTVGDTRADELTGVRGLPQRLGPRTSMTAMAVLVAAAAVVLLAGMVAGGWTARTIAGAALLTTGALLAAGTAVSGVGVGGGRAAFRVTLGAVGLVVLGFVVSVPPAAF
jgi:4-hydroxybenzoate polyprenyltransferase